jgi:hypothetical protein
MRTSILIVLIMTALAATCARDPDAAIKARVATRASLSETEFAQLLDATGRAMTGKTMRVRQGAMARALTERERQQIFDVLGDPRGLSDAGLTTVGGRPARGVRVQAASAQSEIEATSTVWIDVASLLPCRYDFAYVAPGFGDVTLELTFETTS